MTNEEKLKLQKTACKVRMGVLTATYGAKAGHPVGSLSAADVFTNLYFKELNIDPKQPKLENRNRFVLSKGHTAAGMALGLKHQGNPARVYTLLGDGEMQEGQMWEVLKAARERGRIVTCEEHSIIGGLGEVVCAVIAEHGIACPVKRVGVNDEFKHSGPAAALLEQFGLCGAAIAEVACQQL